MKELVDVIWNLDGDAFLEMKDRVVTAENALLVSHLILTAIRRISSDVLRSNSDISSAALDIMSKLKDFRKIAVHYDETLNYEIDSLLMSLLLNKFPNGLKDFPLETEELMTLDLKIYEAFAFCGLSLHLKQLIVDRIRKECLTTVESFKEEFEESALDAALDKLSKLIANFEHRFPDIGTERGALEEDIDHCIVTTRSNEIFDIVKSFPESKPALIDLRQSCARTGSHRKVSEVTVNAFVARLLHLGAATSDIVTIYINAIQSLNIVDGSGGLTRAVSPPIQQYLTTRADLLDTIVNGILEDDSLVASAVSAQKPNDDDILRDANEQKDLDFKWSPEPLHSHIRNLKSLMREGSDSDALALLLNVYGAIGSFVTQLEKEIAKRVESNSGFAFDNEVRAVELLKRRFGSQSFLNCEVILKDVADSKRSAAIANCGVVQPLVVSHLYWPDLPSDYLKLPEEVEQEMDSYTEEFERLKHPRKLKWVPTAGCAEIELAFEDGETMQITVSPVCACVALLMNQETELTPEIICENLEVSRQVAEQALTFWTQNNVFLRSGNVYTMSPTKPTLTAAMFDEEPENESENEGEVEDEVEPHIRDADTFGNFVRTILVNQKEQSTLPKLYELMQKFIVYPKFTRTYEQYVKIIGVLVDRGMVSIEEDTIRLIQE